MPIGDFAWMSAEEAGDIDWETIDTDGDDGYILEVDLDYPSSLHADHSSFPLAPERLRIGREQWSPYSKCKQTAVFVVSCFVQVI
jgi:hypothetical protein